MNSLKAINYLENHYLDDNQALFPIILILNSLNSCQLKGANKIKKEIFSFLIKEKSSNNSFNYWCKDSASYLKEPYPNDLDDTFCAWEALFHFDKEIINELVLLDLSKILLLNQKKNSGPYFTWIVNKNDFPKWKNIDLLVNINIARFLTSQKILVKGLDEFIDEKILSEDLSSVYYKGELASLYFLSYFYKGQLKNKIKEKLILYLNQKTSDSSMILLFIATIRFGFEDLLISEHLKIISSLQEKDGSVNSFDFYNYRNQKTGEKCYGSKSLSTAFFLELLMLLEKMKLNKKESKLKSDLMSVFKQKTSILKDEKIEEILVKKANSIINGKESDLAIFLPRQLIISLKKKVRIGDEIILRLSLINLFAWLAYTIYDHINDQEGDFDKLPIANLVFQLLIKEVLLLPNGAFYLYKIINLFTMMEKNFLEELNFYRFDNQPWMKISEINESKIKIFLYNKSIGQIFSVYFLLDYLELKDKKIILAILRNLILIKQMNDDAHDCFKDLSAGQINSVNYILLKHISSEENRNQFLCKKIEELKIIYYKEIIPVFSKKIFLYIKKTKSLLIRQTLLKEDDFFMKVLSKYENITKEGLRERTNLINYLN